MTPQSGVPAWPRVALYTSELHFFAKIASKSILLLLRFFWGTLFTMESIDEILLEAENLEHGYGECSSLSIGLTQLSDFFSRVEKQQSNSYLNGQFLLAQQGIDSGRTDHLIKELAATFRREQKPKLMSQTKMTIEEAMRPKMAIELFEKNIQLEVDDSWSNATNELIEFIGDEVVSKKRKLDNSGFIKNKGGQMEEEATIYAKNVQGASSLPDATEILERCLNALNEIKEKHPMNETIDMKMDYFVALKYILQNALNNDIQEKDKNVYMIQGALDFLHTQFLNINFPVKDNTNSSLTEIDIDEYVAKEYPNVKPPWPNIWIAIRAGAFNIVKLICNRYPETDEFFKLFSNIVVNGEEPTSTDKNLVSNDTIQETDEEQFKIQCYSFAVGFELQQPQNVVLRTAEDYLFCVLSPLRFVNSNDNFGANYGALAEIQNLVKEEASKFFSKGTSQFIYSMILLMSLQFQEAVDVLIKAQIFPIESIHISMIMKDIEFWNGPELPYMIDEFIKLLPTSMYLEAIDYLSFADNEEKLISFLNTLSPKLQQYVDLSVHGKENAVKLIQNSISKNPTSYSTFHVLVVCKDYENAYNFLLNIEDDITIFTLEEAVKSISLCTVLLTQLLNQSQIQKVQILCTKISILALSRSDSLSQNERATLMENIDDFISVFEDIKENDEYMNNQISIVEVLSHVCLILNLFDSGKYEIAIQKAKSSPRLFPFNIDDIDVSVDWVLSNTPPSTTLIGTVSSRIILYLSLNSKENKDEIQAMLKFTSRINLGNDTTKNLLELHDRDFAFL